MLGFITKEDVMQQRDQRFRGFVRLLATVVMATSSLVVSGVAFGAPGDTDTSFGSNGFTRIDFGKWDAPWEVVSLPDGDMLIAGSRYDLVSESSDWGLARLNPDGSLDAGFGSGGVTVIDHAAEEAALDASLQADGKIVVTGWDGTHMQLGRINADGSLDQSFGLGGFTPELVAFPGVATQVLDDGRIAVAGGAFKVAMFNANGTLDRTFGLGGILDLSGRLGITSTTDPGYCVDETCDGYIGNMLPHGSGVLISGAIPGGDGDMDMGIVKLTPTGALDPAFSGDGITVVPTPAGVDSFARDVDVAADGRILLTGNKGAGNSAVDATLALLNADGFLNTSFGNGGMTTLDLSWLDSFWAGAFSSDGSILAVGDTRASGAEALIASYTATGALDTSFSGDGMTFLDLGNREGLRAALFDGGLVSAGLVDGDVFVTKTSLTKDGDGGGGTIDPIPPGCTIVGTQGADTLVGTSGNDVICGLGGNDTISGESGSDTLYGGSGDDQLRGRDGVKGNDRLDGGEGRDNCRADKGDVLVSCP